MCFEKKKHMSFEKHKKHTLSFHLSTTFWKEKIKWIQKINRLHDQSRAGTKPHSSEGLNRSTIVEKQRVSASIMKQQLGWNEMISFEFVNCILKKQCFVWFVGYFFNRIPCLITLKFCIYNDNYNIFHPNVDLSHAITLRLLSTILFLETYMTSVVTQVENDV